MHFPVQGTSRAGKKGGLGDARSGLLKEFFRLWDSANGRGSMNRPLHCSLVNFTFLCNLVILIDFPFSEESSFHDLGERQQFALFRTL